jgi:hypothetical protein
MRRENEFKLYLENNGTPAMLKDYPSHCKAIEKSMHSDMDDIIIDYKKISTVKDFLLSNGYPAVYMSGFNAYLKFAFSTTKSISTISVTSVTSTYYHVARAKDVPLTPEVELVCQTLEQEYAKIIQFAKKLRLRGSFDAIPIIISNETPEQDSPEGGENVLGRFFGSIKPYIEIYYRNFKPHDAAKIRNCLAHEYLHYLHFTYAGIEYDNAKKELKEGMADFFGFIYSINLNGKDDLKIAKNRYNSWKRNFGSYWPYASALYFLRICGNEMKYSTKYDNYVKYGCIGKFVQVFLSTEHPDDAYLAMLH